MTYQIIGTLSDEGFDLKFNCINLFYRSKLRDTGIHRKEELGKLRIVEMSKFFEVCVSFVFIHERKYITCPTTTHLPKSGLSSLQWCSSPGACCYSCYSKSIRRSLNHSSSWQSRSSPV